MTAKFTQKEQERMAQGMPPWDSMSLACGGWLQFYLFGVGKAMQVAKLDRNVMYAGCSAGSLAAAGLALEGDFDDAIVYCKEDAVPTAYDCIANLFELQNYVGGSIDRLLVPKFTQEKAKNLQVSATRVSLFGTAERIKTFRDGPDFKSALLASCAAFPAAAMEYRDGAYYLDGGFTDFQPVIDENTITVSPFYFSDADIKPSRYVPLWWAFLPPNSNDTIDWLYSLGYEDGLAYIKKRDVLNHITRKPHQQQQQDLSMPLPQNNCTAPKPHDVSIGTSLDEGSVSFEDIPPHQPVVDSPSKHMKQRKTAPLPVAHPVSDDGDDDGNDYTHAIHTTNNSSETEKSPISVTASTNDSNSSNDRHGGHSPLTPKKVMYKTGRKLRSLLHDLQALYNSRMTTQPHEYDTPRKVSMHRFLGYDLAKMTNNRIAFICDLYLLFLLICVWKPMALCLIYFELLFRVFYLTWLCGLKKVGLNGRVLYFLRIWKRRNVGGTVASSYPMNNAPKTVEEKLYDCVVCVLSLSLLLRFISGRPSCVELRKHDRLAKHSLLYRVFRHII